MSKSLIEIPKTWDSPTFRLGLTFMRQVVKYRSEGIASKKAGKVLKYTKGSFLVSYSSMSYRVGYRGIGKFSRRKGYFATW